MRLDWLKIQKFKNLVDFFIDFDEASPITVIVGRNGAAKSNLQEALILIFRNLDLNEPPPFGYELQYRCRKHLIHILADPQAISPIRIKVDDKEVPRSRLTQQSEQRALPNFVFGYYSGLSNRMEAHFDKHQNKFYEDLLRGVDKPLRPLFYARAIHSQFALLAFFSKPDPDVLKFLDEQLSIVGLDSILFVMSEPGWKSKEGDPRFWNARGTVRQFLNKLYELSLAPLRFMLRVPTSFRKSEEREHLYLYLAKTDSLQDLARQYSSQQEFFKALESTYISNLIREVRIRIKLRNVDGSLTFRELSEGEQQLLMVLGLLRFTNEEESLFLLDEPDTHLNPAWSRHYLDFLRQMMGDHQNSHILMTSHNPLTLAGLEQQQVQIMLRDSATGQVTAEQPEENPKGMGVASILTSEVFGLSSSLDPATEHLLDERRELTVKEERNGLSEMERKRLADVEAQLEALDFIAIPDPLYERFVMAMTQRTPLEIKQQETRMPRQVKQQKQLALAILQELEAEEQNP